MTEPLTAEEVQHIRLSAHAAYENCDISATHRDHIRRLCDTIDHMRAVRDETGYSVLPGVWAQRVVDAGLAEFTAGAPNLDLHQRIRWLVSDSETQFHAIREAMGDSGKVLWRGKTRPLTLSDPQTRSFVDLCGPAFDIPSGTEVAVVLTGEDGGG